MLGVPPLHYTFSRPLEWLVTTVWISWYYNMNLGTLLDLWPPKAFLDACMCMYAQCPLQHTFFRTCAILTPLSIPDNIFGVKSVVISLGLGKDTKSFGNCRQSILLNNVSSCLISWIGDHPRDSDYPRDGDHPRMVIKVWPKFRNGNSYGTATVLRMVTILGMVTVQGTVIVQGMGNIIAMVGVDNRAPYIYSNII